MPQQRAYFNYLRKAIEDVCHFGKVKNTGDDQTKAYMLIRIILNTVVKGLKEDGFVRIKDFGTFRVKPGWKLRPKVYFKQSRGQYSLREGLDTGETYEQQQARASLARMRAQQSRVL